MAYLSILRTTKERCEQCDSTEHVLNFVISDNAADDTRLVACLICVIVAMDNAMEWNMSRQFAQALANRAAGEAVQLLTKQAKEKLDARLREAEARTDPTVSDRRSSRKGEAVRTDSGPDDGRSAKPAPDVGVNHRDGRTTRPPHHRA